MGPSLTFVTYYLVWKPWSQRGVTLFWGLLELGRDTGLLADFVGRDSIKLFVTLDRNHLGAICIDGMVAAFSQQVEAIFFQISGELTPFNRHVELLPAVVQ